jgi:ABC-type antimicrobial peptide transport system permease subunit
MLDKLSVGTLDSLQNSEGLKSRYLFDEALLTRFKLLSFFKYDKDHKLTKQKEQVKARITDEKSEFYRFIKSNDEIAQTEMFFTNSGFGCIVTKSYLNKIGLIQNQPQFLHYSSRQCKESIPIEIVGVVSELPDNADVLISRKFFNAAQNGGNNFDIHNEYHATYAQYFIPEIQALDQEVIDSGFKKEHKNNLLLNGIFIQKNRRLKPQDQDLILKTYPKALRTFDLSIDSVKDADLNPDRIVFSFNKLDSVGSFSKYLLNDELYRSSTEQRLKIDLNTIEDKKNFVFFNRLANFLSFGLIAFSVFLIFTYTTNLLTNHISRNRMSIGTLKAFGLSNKNILLLYSLISCLLIFTAFIVSYSISLTLGRGFLHLFNDWILTEYNTTLVLVTLDISILLTLFVLLPLVVIFYALQSHLRKSTPGDLIYGR